MEVDLKNCTSPVGADGWGITQVESVKYSYNWSMKDFTAYWTGVLTSVSDTALSPAFTINGNENWKWQIRLRFFAQNNDKTMVRMELINNSEVRVKARWKVTILDANGRDFHKADDKVVVNNTIFIKYLIEQDTLLEKLPEILQNDTLTLRCDIIIFGETKNLSNNSVLPEVRNALSCLSEDFGNLLKSETFSDLTLDVAGREFKVHKNILCSRSPVFASMLQHKMKESESSRVEVQDISPDVMEQLLQFIYTGKADKIEEMAMDLLFASDKYGLEGLKDICSRIIVATLSIENAAEMLVVADRHSVAQLKSHVINFIKLRGKEVMETEGWKTFAVAHPKLVAELLTDYMKGK